MVTLINVSHLQSQRHARMRANILHLARERENCSYGSCRPGQRKTTPEFEADCVLHVGTQLVKRARPRDEGFSLSIFLIPFACERKEGESFFAASCRLFPRLGIDTIALLNCARFRVENTGFCTKHYVERRLANFILFSAGSKSGRRGNLVKRPGLPDPMWEARGGRRGKRVSPGETTAPDIATVGEVCAVARLMNCLGVWGSRWRFSVHGLS